MTTPTVPPPAAAAHALCPVCGAAYALPARTPCASCGADLTGPIAARIQEVDRDWAQLAAERADLVAQLAATRAPGGPPPVPASSQPSPDTPGRGRVGVPTLLALAGVALLTTAAIVFTAVAWTGLPALAKAAVLLAATGLSAAAAVLLQRRHLPTTAGAAGVVAMAFAAVDVAGADAAGLLALDRFAVPVAAVAAAAAGLILGRVGVRWVSTAGALGAFVAAVGVTVAVAELFDLGAAGVAFAGVGAAVALTATVVVWPTRPGRWTAAVGGVLWLTVSGLIAAVALFDPDPDLVPAAAAGLAIVLLAAGARWNDWAVAPATLLVTVTVVGVAVALGATDLAPATVAAATVAGLGWGVGTVAPRWRWPVLVGAVAAVSAVTGVVGTVVTATVERWVATAVGTGADPVDPWGAATVALAGAALLAVPHIRERTGWVIAPTLVVVSATVPTVVAWPALLLAAVVGAVGAATAPTRWDPLAVLATGAIAVGFAAEASGTLALAAAALTAAAAWLGLRGSGVRGRIALATAAASVALAGGAAGDAAGANLDVVLGIGLVLALTAVVGLLHAARPRSGLIAPLVVAGLATVVVPPVASSPRAGGVLVLLAGAGWVAIAATGWVPARWIAAVVLPVGSGMLVADAGVEVVEAYTIAPTLTLAAAGLWWLVEDRAIRTVVALGPALTVALAPSLVVLLGDPRVLARTLALTVAAGLLATVGVRVRWLAPTLAGSITAGGVAVSQVVIAVQVVPRWVTFAVVGVLLVLLAATYERGVSRARRLGVRVATYR